MKKIKLKLLLTFLIAFAAVSSYSNKVSAAKLLGWCDRYKTWYINVNKPIDKNTLTAKNVKVFDDNNNEVKVNLDVYQGTSIRVAVNDKGYTPGHTYYINLSLGIKSIYGDPLNLGAYALNYFMVNPDTEADISDSTLQAAVRKAANKPTGTLMQSDLDKITSLSISDNYGARSIDFTDITKLHNLNKITFYNSSFKNLSNVQNLSACLRYMKSFNTIDLSNNVIGANASALLDDFSVDYISNLDLSNTGITDISHLYKFKNLNIVDLSNNKISNVYSIGTLNVSDVNLSNNAIVDISGLNSDSQLTKLNLSNNKIVDLSPLSSLPILNTLDVSNNNKQVSAGGYDLSPLANLVTLENLNLSNDNVKNIAPLENLDAMVNINLNSNGIQDISGLENMSLLENLSLANNYLISDISVIKNLENVDSIDLSGNKVRDLSPLANLTKLTSLNLGYNNISDVTPLQDLTQLEELELNDNSITDVYPLMTLTNLNTLYIKDNGKIDTTPLGNLGNLSHKDF